MQLLADSSVNNQIASLKAVIDSANSNGVPFFIGEGNSVACGGESNVSDVFAATLWSVDTLFVHASASVQRWNFHGCPEGAYTAIAYNQSEQDVPDVRPLYYGMLAFTMATRLQAALLEAAVTTSNELIKAHASVNDAGDFVVTLIHKDVAAKVSASVEISLPAEAGTGAGSLIRVAPDSGSPFAHHGIKIAGQTFDGSTDGRPVGTFSPEAVARSSDGSYAFALAPGTIAIFVLAK